MPFFIVLVFLAFITCLRAQESPVNITPSPQQPYVEHQEKNFRFYPGGKVSISLEGHGNIKIIGWKKGSIQMDAENIIYYLPEATAREFLKTPPVRVRYTDTSATIQVSGSPEPPGILETNLTLYVPGEKTDLRILMNQGDLLVDTVNGWIEAKITEGDLEAKSVSGYFSGTTQRGNVHVEMSDNRWKGLEFGGLTQNGSIELCLPVKYSAALQLETRNGNIVIDYPPQMVDGEEIPLEIITKKSSQLLRASVGDGGAPLRLSTYDGDITLSRKANE